MDTELEVVLLKKKLSSILSNLIHSDEEAVDVVSWGAGVQCFLVLLDLNLDKLPHLLNVSKNSVLVAGQVLH